MRRTASIAPLLLALAAALLLARCGREADPGSIDGPPVEAPGSGAWGESVGGLVIGLDVPRAVYQTGDRMVFGVRARNDGAEAILLPFFDDSMWHYRVTFENLGDGPDWWGGSGLFVDFSEPPDVTLEPGQTWEQEADLNEERRRYLRIIPGRKPGDDWDYRDHLPAGRYQVWLEYVAPGSLKPDAWKGKVRSNVVEVTVEEGA